MNVSEACREYFSGFHDLPNIPTNIASESALTILKIISYITVIFPLFFGIIYVASSFWERASDDSNNQSPTQERVHRRASENFGFQPPQSVISEENESESSRGVRISDTASEVPQGMQREYFSSLSSNTGQVMCEFLKINELSDLAVVNRQGQKLADDNLVILAKRVGYKKKGGELIEVRKYLIYLIQAMKNISMAYGPSIHHTYSSNTRKIDFENTVQWGDRYRDESCSPNRGDGCLPIYYPASKGLRRDLCEIELFLKNGGDINAISANGRTPLSIAIRSAHVKAVELLLERGASLSIPDKNGRFLIHYAACYSYCALMDKNSYTYILGLMLERHGSDWNERDEKIAQALCDDDMFKFYEADDQFVLSD